MTRAHAIPAAVILASCLLGVRPGATAPWQGEELPLPMVVRTPADLQLKTVAERQYLIFNLIASGKQAWDKGDFTTAAQKWETLLRLPGLDSEVERVVRPLAVEARTRSRGQTPASPPAADKTAPKVELAPRAAERVAVTGTVSGGGALGPGGAVVWLKRADGPTPRPSSGRGKVMNQIDKRFVPRVLPVPVGSQVDFKNKDTLFHNVFSLSRPNDFDAGLYKSGQSYTKTFDKPGAVQVLCNIHASMVGYVVVVDSPWYGQADAAGAFSIRGVPPGAYVLEIWHESANDISRTKVTVPSDGLRGLAVRVGGDRGAPRVVPDKYGKPRQSQLGY